VSQDQHIPAPARRSDTKVALACAASAFVMVGMAYAAVPLYQMFCQVTGLGGTTQRAVKPSDVVLDRKVTVRFDANVSPKLGWKFEPVQRTVEANIGENVLVFYRATNISDKTIKGAATFNVAPDAAGLYFSKIECFCFTEQTLAAGETVEMPVSFYVDPALVTDPESSRLKEITLSYTFYPVAERVTGGQASVQSSKSNPS
jgi:cytochrome c oxidase assembly protein subunit 11